MIGTARFEPVLEGLYCTSPTLEAETPVARSNPDALRVLNGGGGFGDLRKGCPSRRRVSLMEL